MNTQRYQRLQLRKAQDKREGVITKRATFPSATPVQGAEAEMVIIDQTPVKRGYEYPSYTKKIFRINQFQELVDEAAPCVERLLKLFPTVQAFAGTGNSGVPLISALGYKLGIPFITVRKAGESSHCGRSASGYFGGDYIIFDDLIASGNTINRIIKEIGKGNKCRAIVLYNDKRIGPFCSKQEGNLEIPIFSLCQAPLDHYYYY